MKGEKSNDNIWNDVSDVLHKDADHVFKMIGEAYSILSDTTKVFKLEENYMNN